MNGSTWVQMGANMEGAMFDDKMGTAVAMNVGDRLITGAPLFDKVVFLCLGRINLEC